MKIYDLRKGDKFILNDKEFTCLGLIKKYMPTIGKVWNMKAIDGEGKISLFFRNWDVELKK